MEGGVITQVRDLKEVVFLCQKIIGCRGNGEGQKNGF